MCAELFSTVDIEVFEKELSIVIGSAQSLGEIEA